MSIEGRLKTIVVEQLGVDDDEVKDNTDFVEDLGADSLDQIELIMAAEEEFGIEIPDEVCERLKTFGDAVVYVRTNTRQE